MLALRVALLGASVAWVLGRPLRLPAWIGPVVAVGAAVIAGAVAVHVAVGTIAALGDALGFLLAAVPLSVLLDRLGFFEHLARLLSGGRRVGLGLWLLAAGVTAVLNLDASVVLLTPLYVRVARRLGLSVHALAFQPALLACLASSVLPVSNLTNLIASSATGVGVAAFVVHLGPASVAAVAVGYLGWLRRLPPGQCTLADREPPERRPLLIGFGTVALVLTGFVAGPLVGIQPWEVALAADGLLAVVVGSVPLRSVPLGTASVAAALGVLATSVARGLDIASVLAGSGWGAEVRDVGLATLGADVANNLPAILVARDALGHGSSGLLWAVLLGVNAGPTLVVSGALSGLLWMDLARRNGVEVDARGYSAVGLAVGLPALVAATAVLVATLALAGSG